MATSEGIPSSIDIEFLELNDNPYSTGVLRMAEIGEEGDKYILSPLGVKFMKWALESPVEVKKISGTSTNMAWSPIGEDEIDEITDKYGAEKQYKESDQAMFDYDVLRGK